MPFSAPMSQKRDPKLYKLHCLQTLVSSTVNIQNAELQEKLPQWVTPTTTNIRLFGPLGWIMTEHRDVDTLRI